MSCAYPDASITFTGFGENNASGYCTTDDEYSLGTNFTGATISLSNFKVEFSPDLIMAQVLFMSLKEDGSEVKEDLYNIIDGQVTDDDGNIITSYSVGDDTSITQVLIQFNDSF